MRSIWRLIVFVGVVLLALNIAWWAWGRFGPRKVAVGPSRRQIADQVISAIVDDLRTARQAVRSVALLHLANDPSDYVTDHLRVAIEQSGLLNLRDRTFTEKVRESLRLPQPAAESVGEAVARGRSLGVEGVIYGKVFDYWTDSRGSKIDLQIGLADVAEGKSVFERRFTKEVSSGGPVGLASGPLTAEEEVSKLSPATRLIAWALAVLLLPVFTISFVRTMVRKESNKANAFTLAVYTGVDALLAYSLLGLALTSWLPIALFVLAVLLAFAYNVRIMSFALKLET
jgi:hypothetical protein